MLHMSQPSLANSLPEAMCMDIHDLERDYTWRDLFHDDIVRARFVLSHSTALAQELMP